MNLGAEEREQEWQNVNQIMELVKQEGDARCERAFDFLISALAEARGAFSSGQVQLERTENALKEARRERDAVLAEGHAEVQGLKDSYFSLWRRVDRLVAESLAVALREAMTAMMEADNFGSAYEAVRALAHAAEAKLGAPRCRPENHPDDCEPRAQEREGNGEK